MRNAQVMGLAERRQRLSDDARRPPQRERLLSLEQARQARARHELHHQEQVHRLAGRPAEVVHADHVRMVHQAQRPRLLREARDRLRRSEQSRMDDLDRHRPLERHLDRSIDPSAAPGVDQIHDLVAAGELLANQRIASRRTVATLFGPTHGAVTAWLDLLTALFTSHRPLSLPRSRVFGQRRKISTNNPTAADPASPPAFVSRAVSPRMRSSSRPVPRAPGGAET